MIHLIHGIHTLGAGPVSSLVPYLHDFETADPDYGWILGIETRILNPVIVGALLPYIGHGDVIIGHSNGCAIAYDLMNRCNGIAGAVFINAALEQGIARPSSVPWIDVYYNAGDEVTEVAKLGAQFGITDPVWGEMGHAGYSGSDLKITSIDCGNTPKMPVVSGHSDFFTTEKLTYWAPFLVNRIKAHLQ